VTVEMQFLACRAALRGCNGTRYHRNPRCRYKGKNNSPGAADDREGALRFFCRQTRLLEKLAVLDEIGLGYLRWASPRPRCPGEAQRVSWPRTWHRCAPPMQHQALPGQPRPLHPRRAHHRPLHFDDVSKLLTAFRKTIDGGGSADRHRTQPGTDQMRRRVIDLGPEGGEAGGRIVPKARPRRSRQLLSHTGKWRPRML